MLLNELSNKISTNNIWHKTKNKFHDITNKFLGKIKEVKTSPVKLTSFRSIPETPNIATTTKKNSLDFSCQLTAKPTKNSDKYTPEIFFHRLDSLTQTTQKTFPLVDSQYGKTPLERLEAATKKNHDAYIEQRISAKAPPTLSQFSITITRISKNGKKEQ